MTGADSIVYEINASSAGLNASQLTEEKYKKYIDGSTIVAQSVTSDKIKSHTIVADNVDIGDLFAATATIDALETMTVKSIEDGSALILNKDQIRMETPSTVIAIPGGEEGQEVFRADAGGVYADKIESPTVVRRVPGGIYSVGANMDFGSLDEACDWLEGAQITGDITFKLVRAESGATLRGVLGGHNIRILSANLVNYWDAPVASSNVTSAANSSSNGIILTSTGTLPWQSATYDLGHIGDMGLSGMPITVHCGGFYASGTGAGCILSLRVTSAGFATYETLHETYSADDWTGVIGSYPDDARLALTLFQSRGDATAGGAMVEYNDLRIELGGALTGLNSSVVTVDYLIVTRCQPRVRIGRLATNSIFAEQCDINLVRTGIWNAGVRAEMARLQMRDCTGLCTQAVRAKCAQVYVTGAAPSGTYEGWQIDRSTATISGSGSAPTTTTKTLTANSTGTYSSYWWAGDQSIRQGYTPSNNRIRGGMWFDMSQTPSGATVSGMRLTLSRISGYGKSADVDVKAYATASDARNGAPALTAGSYELGTIGEGKTKTFDLPDALVTGLKSGTYKGIVLYADDTTVLSGKTYSSNYARFGGTDGTAPKLAVTYTA